MVKVILKSDHAPGDEVMLTGAVRDLVRGFAGQYQVDVRTRYPAIWFNNPWITEIPVGQEVDYVIPMHYPVFHKADKRGVHFVNGFQLYLQDCFGFQIPVRKFGGDIHLSDDEKLYRHEKVGNEKYWVLIAGGKWDFTAKWWHPDNMQILVDECRKSNITLVRLGGPDDWHPPLKGSNLIDLVGKTSLREAILTTYRAAGVICPVTFFMHLSAAMPMPNGDERPCVVIAGGRETPAWEAYPTHRFLHNVGSYPCCRNHACWINRCQIPPADKDHFPRGNQTLCHLPVAVDDIAVPACMADITPDMVMEAIHSYDHRYD